MYSQRIKFYEKLENLRQRPLIAYVTSLRAGVNVQMGVDAISEIIRQIQLIPLDKKEIDFLIISNGGDPICSLRIINILSERFNKINVIVPYIAYSAATLLALGANKIVMHPYSNLGPVDPQMFQRQTLPDGRNVDSIFAAADIKSYFQFLKEDIGVHDQQALSKTFEILTNQIAPTVIGAAKNSSQLANSLCEKFLSRHMKDTDKAQRVSKSLITSFYNHSYAVSRSEAKKIGLNIEYPTQEEEKLLWDIWEDFEKEMVVSKQFNPQEEIVGQTAYKNFLLNQEQSVTFNFSIYVASVESRRAISTNNDTVTVVAQKIEEIIQQGMCQERRIGINHIPMINRTGWMFNINKGGNTNV